MFLFLDGSTVQCWPFTSFMDFSLSALFFWPLFPVYNFASTNICLYTDPPSIFGRSLNPLPWWLLIKYLICKIQLGQCNRKEIFITNFIILLTTYFRHYIKFNCNNIFTTIVCLVTDAVFILLSSLRAGQARVLSLSQNITVFSPKGLDQGSLNFLVSWILLRVWWNLQKPSEKKKMYWDAWI